MKNLFTIILFLFITDIQAQIEIIRNDLAQIGDNFIYGIVKFAKKDSLNIDEIGKNYWDFSKYKPQLFDTIRIINPSETRYYDKFKNSNVALYRNRANIIYLNQSKDKIEKVGVIQDYMNLKASIILNFDDSITQLILPLKYKAAFSDTTQKKFLSPYYLSEGTDSIRADMDIIEQSVFDAYGTIKTPMGEYQTLREKHIVKRVIAGYKFSMYGWTPAPEYNRKDMQIVYYWWIKNGGIPVAVAETDKFGNISTIKFQFVEPMKITFKTKNVNCKNGKNGKIEAVIKGGVPDYQYKWSNGATTKTISDLKAGTYTLTVTDNKKTILTQSCIVTEPDIELSVKFDKKDISCFNKTDGTIKLNIVGGETPYLVKWKIDSTTTTIRNLKAGYYAVKIKDKNQCMINDSVEIIAPMKPLTVKFIPYDVKCYNSYDGAIEAVVTGGTPEYTYKWSNHSNEKKIENLKAGSYSVTVTDKHNCTVTDLITIKQPGSAIQYKIYPKPVNCFGGDDGAVELYIKGGGGTYKVDWSNEKKGNSIKHLTAGKYVFTITDNMHCVVKDSLIISQPADSLRLSHIKKDVSCYGGNDAYIELLPKGGTPDYRFTWMNGETKQKLNGISAGFYRVSVFDKNNCMVKDTISIFSPQKPLKISSDQSNVKCKSKNDGSVSVEVSGGTEPYSYQWSNGNKTSNAASLKADDYEVIVKDKNGCEIRKKFNLTEPETAIKVESKLKQVGCFGESEGEIELIITGGTPYYSFEWSNGLEYQKIKGLNAGIYKVKITDKIGCVINEVYEITQPQKLIVEYSISTEADSKIKLNIQGGTQPYKILWNTGDTKDFILNPKPGNYEVTVTDAKLCEVTKKIVVKNQ